eukprot:CCRYP_014749-RA/>CCRYP_014749-RA protein AED:0.26 eAED:0.26 QI:0/0/0/1/0/0/2/0/1022
MILYHVDSNSIWAEPTRNKTEGKLILARNRDLQCMKACGIQPTRQVLDNEISAAYKLAITASGMTYQLVPPDDHRRNIAEKAIQTWKDHFIAVISGTDAKFPSTFGANYYHKWNANSVFYGNPMHTPTFPPIRISTAIMTTTHTLSSPWAWKPLSTTNPTTANLLPNTAPRGMSSAHPTSTTTAGKCGHQLRKHHPYLCHSLLQTQVHHQPSVTPADAIIAAAANLSHLLTNNLQAHHNNKVNQSDLTRLQILTQPSPPPQHNATHYQQHSPNATHPSSPAAVSDYDSDSSDSDDESITIPHPVPRLPLQPPRVSPQQTKTPLPRVSAPPSSPAYNTRSSAHTITQETILHLLHKTRTPLTPRRAATRQFPREALSAILDTDTGELLKYRHLIKNPKYCTIWKNAYGKELGRLAQGIPGTVKGTNTIVFIVYNEIPPQRRKDVTYGRIVANYRPEKEDPYRIRLTVGGNRITYPGDCGTPTADMLTTKILLNSVISTKGARFMTIDIKDFYLNTPMVRPEYMRLKLSDIPDHIIKLYKLDKLVTTDGYAYVLIQKECTVSHRRASSLNNSLKKGWPSKATGKVPSHLVSGNTTGALSPSLCVLTTSMSNMLASNMHSTFYKLSTNTTKRHKTGRVSDTSGSQSHGTIPSNKYNSPCQDTAKRAATVFTTLFPSNHSINPILIHPALMAPNNSLSTLRMTQRYSPTPTKPSSRKSSASSCTHARAVDCTMLPALGSLATQQLAPTQNTMSKIHQFLDYAMTHPDAMITYRASNMILAVHSDASYLSETKARSRAGGTFFLSEDDPSPRNNGTILNLTQIIKPVMSSAAEAELGALYINARKQYHNDTFSMNWDIHNLQLPYKLTTPQPLEWSPTSSNPNAPKQWTCIFIGSVVEKIKTVSHLLAQGTTNLADYVTKHHPAIHHQAVRHIYLSTPTKLLLLRHKAHNILQIFHTTIAPMALTTFDSGADGHYLSERNRAHAQHPILHPSTKRVSVANGSCSHDKHVTALPLKYISPRAAQADSF